MACYCRGFGLPTTGDVALIAAAAAAVLGGGAASVGCALKRRKRH